MHDIQPAIVNAVAPTYANNAHAPLSMDANSALRVNVVAGGAGGGAVTIADGADVDQGATTDVAVTTDTNGTLSAKIRGIIVILLRMFQLATPIRNQQVGINTTELVDAGANAVTVTGNRLDVNATVSGTVTTTPPANASTNVAQLAGTATSVNSGAKDAGTLRVVIATDQPQLTNKLLVTPDSVAVPVLASTSGGATPYSYIAAAAANQDSIVVKNAAGQLYSIVALSTIAALRYLKIYDKATAPTSSDTPILRLPIPANNSTGAGFVLPIFIGAVFANGISFRITVGIADNDAAACTANDVVVNLCYK